MKLNWLIVLGLFLLVVGIGMFLWGIHMFTYQGEYSKLMTTTGEYSLIFLLPTFIIGAILGGIGIAIAVSKNNSKERNNLN